MPRPTRRPCARSRAAEAARPPFRLFSVARRAARAPARGVLRARAGPSDRAPARDPRSPLAPRSDTQACNRSCPGEGKMRRQERGLCELYAEDPERADWLVFGRVAGPGRRGFLKGAGLATMSAVLGASIPFH